MDAISRPLSGCLGTIINKRPCEALDACLCAAAINFSSPSCVDAANQTGLFKICFEISTCSVSE